MKPLLLAAAAMIAALSLPAVAREKVENVAITPQLVAAAEKEGSVVIQNSQPADIMPKLVEGFAKLYPKIHVDTERKTGAGGAQSIIAEYKAGVHRIDVYNNGNPGANGAVLDQNILLAIAPDSVGRFAMIALPMAPFLYFPTVVRNVIEYNPTKITEAQVRKLEDWQGILDPDFGNVASWVEPTIGPSMASLVYIMDAPNLGEDFLRKIKSRNFPIFLNSAQGREAVISGTRPVSWGVQWDSVVLTDIEKGAPVRFVYQSPTIEYPLDGWGVLKSAPHPNAAKLFFAWMMSADGAAVLQEPGVNSRSTMTDVPDDRAIVKKLQATGWYHDPDKIADVSIQDWVTNGDKYLKLWYGIFR